MSRGILFDLYGVIMRDQSPETIAAIERAAGFGGPQLWDVYWATRDDYDAGLISGRDYWLRLAAKAGHSLPDPDAVLAAEVEGWSRADEQMVAYVRGLASGHRVGVLSNLPPEVIELVETTQPWLATLDSVTYSGRVGLVKPDPRIYRIALSGLGLPPADVLYVDDRPVNVEAARGLGMPAVVFTGLARLRPIVDAHLGPAGIKEA
ncbi:HAD family phosphatase [Brooklawnia cerclae]|uniref:Hydrolase of the HAD superfamily n=1 Tax=Brooklawnia cerclae TaxID=349934 RepID=A0ABX0SJM6_9ACTN|nr:HAD family phosphatase [Brooklawnia cerclae]NIH58602.1 putative hydrolase of the HAD superfamily [Brooklawnia cerclae]